MIRTTHRRPRPQAAVAVVAVVLLALAALTACSSDGATVAADRPETGVSQAPGATFVSAPEGCVTVPTTMPGMQFCQGYDPAADLAQQAGGQEPLACPPATAPRPEGGWLGEDGSDPAPPVPELQSAAGSDDDDDLAAAALALLGAGYVVRDSMVLASPRCPDRPPVVRVELAAPTGGRVSVTTERVTGQLFWMEEPVAGELVRTTLPDGTEVAVNDFDGRGVYRRAWVVRPDGSMVRVSAVGDNAASQAGWPTTMATMPGSGTPGPAPLTLGEVQALALALLPA